MIDIQERVEAAKRLEFLRRVCAVSGGSEDRFVPAGDLGTELGLPYEEAIRIAERLDADGLAMLVGELDPPHGPRLQVTANGRAYVAERAA